MAKCLLLRGGLVLLKTSACCGLPIFLKANHQLESRVPEIGLLGSEGGATSSVVPTPIVPHVAKTSRDVPRRFARERVPCLLETCYKEVPDSRESAPLPRFSGPGKRGAGETVASHGAF